jgi:two-component system, OmpR family, response regulator
VRLLLVEDDNKIAQFLDQGLKQAGYAVDLAGDGENALTFLAAHNYDLLILDLMLPRLDGFGVLDQVRSRGHRMPVIILSAKRSVDDRVLGLQKGGDDYLTKPFSFTELLARVQALLRRANPQPSGVEATKLESGGISLNLLSREVRRENIPIELQAKEYSLLEYFMRNPGRVLTKNQILEHVWNYQFDPQTNVVDVLVFRLRSKLDKDFEKKTIQTVRGVGYVFQPN